MFRSIKITCICRRNCGLHSGHFDVYFGTTQTGTEVPILPNICDNSDGSDICKKCTVDIYEFLKKYPKYIPSGIIDLDNLPIPQ